jgi:hypothetical protein
VGDELIEQAFAREAWNNRRPGLTSAQGVLAISERKLGLGRFAAMAPKAALYEKRADVLFEKLQPVRHLGGVVGVNASARLVCSRERCRHERASPGKHDPFSKPWRDHSLGDHEAGFDVPSLPPTTAVVTQERAID